MSLADELLADLEDVGADEDEALLADRGGDDEIEELTEDSARELESAAAYERVTSVARLRDSARFTELLSRVDDGDAQLRAAVVRGPVETHPEYKLVLDANELVGEIGHEMNVIHKFVRDKYAKRFPELESLVPMPHEFLACARELGNDIQTKGQNKEILSRILLPATVIVVSVTASTTQGQQLTEDELAAVNEACDMAMQLNDAKLRIFQFVEQRMTFIAPNLSALLGAGTAAMLMGTAGGLTSLSKMPACNTLVLGAQKRTLSGFSSTAILPHTGYIYYSALVQALTPDLRRKAARVLSAKVALAARVDAVHASKDGSIGRQLFEQIQSKYDKMMDPPSVKKVKALPKPLDQASKKRGGRRARKMKERLGLTDLRRDVNRVTFAALEEDVLQDKMGFSLGQLKTAKTGGRLRAAQVDQKSRVRMSKMLQRNLAKQGGMTSVRTTASTGGATSVRSRAPTTAGTASSVTFTPVQGLEIVNPQAVEKKAAEANAKYFAATAGFLKVQTPLPGATKDAA